MTRINLVSVAVAAVVGIGAYFGLHWLRVTACLWVQIGCTYS
jgi:hypothetical protein